MREVTLISEELTAGDDVGGEGVDVHAEDGAVGVLPNAVDRSHKQIAAEPCFENGLHVTVHSNLPTIQPKSSLP